MGTPSGITDASYARFGTNCAGNSFAGEIGAVRKTFAFTKAHEVIFERHDFASGINTTGEIVKSTGTIEVVLHVVLTGPQQFHRHADFFRDPRGFDHVVVAKSTTKAAACAHHVNLDLVGLDAECRSDQCRVHLRAFVRLTKFRRRRL